MPRTPEKNDRQKQTEVSPERRAEERVQSIEKRISPDVSSLMAAKLKLRQKPTPSAPREAKTEVPRPATKKTQTPIAPERTRETIAPGTENTPERLLESIRSIRISADGRDVPVSIDAKLSSDTGLQRLLQRNSISAARYPAYAQNMRDHARVLSAALAGKNPRSVSFDGLRFSVVDGSRTIVSTATRAYALDASGNVSTLSGTRVDFQDKPNGFEVTVNGQREIHRTDGGLAMTEQGGVRQFFDGSNQVPILEQRNGETFIVGANGARVGMKPRGSMRSFAEAGEWGADIAQRLRTPEAIGAFVSQFFYGQDYLKGSEQAEWKANQIQKPASAIQYQQESAQDVQHWQRTLLQRSGDCEDFALLAQGLLSQAGINSFATMVTPSHYESVFFEPAGIDQSGRETYFVCSVGLRGFQRSTQPFSNLGEAVQSLWDPMNSRASSPSQFVLKGGPAGAVIHDQPKNPSDKKGDVYTAEYGDEAYFRQFIRR